MDMFFFFKQKTAYEMLISDWSSDVCSSDLGALPGRGGRRGGARGTRPLQELGRLPALPSPGPASGERVVRARDGGVDRRPAGDDEGGAPAGRLRPRPGGGQGRRRRCRAGPARSEEHTSELQSLMRISYAVFCLKKKKDRQILYIT